MFEVKFRIVRESTHFRYLEQRPPVSEWLQAFVQFRRQEMLVLSNQNQPLFSVNLVRAILRTEKQVLQLRQLLRANKTDATRTEFTFLQLKEASSNFLTKLEAIVSDKLLRYRSPLAYAPNQVLRTSLLSSDSPEQRYRGLMNLAALLLVALNLRAMIDYLLLYGNRIDEFIVSVELSQVLLSVVLLFGHLNAAWLLHLLCLHKGWKSRLAFLVRLSPAPLLLFSEWVYCNKLRPDPVLGVATAMLAVVFTMKLCSFAHVVYELGKVYAVLANGNQSLRQLFGENDLNEENLKLIQEKSFADLIRYKDLLYFAMAPTLCFQLSYPRSSKIRWGWLCKRLAQLALVSGLQLVLVAKYILPQVQQWAFQVAGGTGVLQILGTRLLRLAVPNLLLWLSGFYSLFQLWLNILAQLLRFGDRDFYGDWWNCTNIEQFWKMWNLPVHFWFIRHLYNPLLKAGCSRARAEFVVFLLSALGHEYLISVPLGVLCYWGYLCMLIQAPMMFLQGVLEKALNLERSQIGNLSFWLVFCFLGQPLLVFVYYYTYVQNTP